MSVVAVSLKMYFDRARTLEYCARILERLEGVAAVTAGAVRVAVLPDFLTLAECADVLRGTPVILGAQDLAPRDRGALTGEVSGADLAGLGVGCVEVGHAERRGIFHEDDALVAGKFAAALRNGLIPLLCVGEPVRGDADAAATYCLEQVRAAVGPGASSEVWIAYEPVWAIGAPEPAPAAHVAEVCRRLRDGVVDLLPAARLLYGGSAGPGLLTALGPSVDGLFLGRFAHDPAALARVVVEAGERDAYPPHHEPTCAPPHERNEP